MANKLIGESIEIALAAVCGEYIGTVIGKALQSCMEMALIPILVKLQ